MVQGAEEREEEAMPSGLSWWRGCEGGSQEPGRAGKVAGLGLWFRGEPRCSGSRGLLRPRGSCLVGGGRAKSLDYQEREESHRCLMKAVLSPSPPPHSLGAMGRKPRAGPGREHPQAGVPAWGGPPPLTVTLHRSLPSSGSVSPSGKWGSQSLFTLMVS